MKEILGPDAPLVEDVTPKSLQKLLRERKADILVAGGRNRYLAVKEGYPFVDVNQERHTAYAGYDGLVNLAGQISSSINFYSRSAGQGARGKERETSVVREGSGRVNRSPDVLIDPLKHSPALGAAMAFQGIHRAIPVLHGAQGCSFLGKVLLTGHFREPIALATSKLFVENVVMGSEENLTTAVQGIIEKNVPDIIGVVTTGLCEVKGDDVASVVRVLEAHVVSKDLPIRIVPVRAPDYDGGLETGYARAVEALLSIAVQGSHAPVSGQINVLIGSHLTPADAGELRECIESFGLRPIMLPDLSALDGSRKGFSPLAEGGTKVSDIRKMAGSVLTLAIGKSMEPAARMLKDCCGVEYRILESITGLEDSDRLVESLSQASGRPMPLRYERQRQVLIDGMRDAQPVYSNKRICLALEPDLAVQTSRWLAEMGASVDLVVVPTLSDAAGLIRASTVEIGGLASVSGKYDLLISNSHGTDAAKRVQAPLLQLGFPLIKVLGGCARATVGFRGTLAMINEVGNLMMKHQ